jgi:hypothetical protein
MSAVVNESGGTHSFTAKPQAQARPQGRIGHGGAERRFQTSHRLRIGGKRNTVHRALSHCCS